MPRMAKAKLNLVPTEDYEQTLLATWLAKQNIKFYAIPNGGQRNLYEAVKLKRMGLQPGIPDLCVPIPSGSYHGLYIELKRTKGGKISDAQKDWIAILSELGYFVSVAYGFEQAKEVVLHYLSLTPKVA